MQIEIAALRDDEEYDLIGELMGSFVHIDEDQVVWRGYSQKQFEDKIPDYEWGRERSRIRHRAWDKTVTEVLINRVLKSDKSRWTEPDDNAIMPIYDVTQMR